MPTVTFTEGVSIFSNMKTIVPELLEMAGSVLTWGIANPVISIPLTVGVIGCGFALVHKGLNLFNRV